MTCTGVPPLTSTGVTSFARGSMNNSTQSATLISSFILTRVRASVCLCAYVHLLLFLCFCFGLCFGLFLLLLRVM